ncbi:Chaperone protein papD precursor [Serratia fonticola]|nr:Chaperone protein papD precursor [Serratia fonticola]
MIKRNESQSMKLVMKNVGAIMLLGTLITPSVYAAVSLDRTRVVYEGDKKSLSLNISNDNKALPYLAQSWIEDAQGNKINSPLTVLPPVQRIEPGAKSQVKIQGLATINSLPQDRESLFYFNLREIPPVSDKPNTLQIALQTRIKMFYRPAPIVKELETWPQKLTLTKVGDRFQLNNPTAFFITIVDASRTVKGGSIAGFEPIMVEPQSHAIFKTSASTLGNTPVLTYINDYGARPKVQFNCSGSSCQVATITDRGE